MANGPDLLSQLSGLISEGRYRQQAFREGAQERQQQAFGFLETNITNAFDGIDYTNRSQLDGLQNYIDQEINNFTHRHPSQAFLAENLKQDAYEMVQYYNTLNTDFANDLTNVASKINAMENYAVSGLTGYDEEFNKFMAEKASSAISKQITEEGFEPVPENIYDPETERLGVFTGFTPEAFNKYQNDFFLKNIMDAENEIKTFTRKYMMPSKLGVEPSGTPAQPILKSDNRFFSSDAIPSELKGGQEHGDLLAEGIHSIEYLKNEYLTRKFEHEASYIDELGQKHTFKTVLNPQEKRGIEDYFNGVIDYAQLKTNDKQINDNKRSVQGALISENHQLNSSYQLNKSAIDYHFQGRQGIVFTSQGAHDIGGGKYTLNSSGHLETLGDKKTKKKVFKNIPGKPSWVYYENGDKSLNRLYVAQNYQDYVDMLESNIIGDTYKKGIIKTSHGMSITEGQFDNSGVFQPIQFVDTDGNETGERKQMNFGDAMEQMLLASGKIKLNSKRFLENAPDAAPDGTPIMVNTFPMEKQVDNNGNLVIQYPSELQRELDNLYHDSGYYWGALRDNDIIQSLKDANIDVEYDESRYKNMFTSDQLGVTPSEALKTIKKHKKSFEDIMETPGATWRDPDAVPPTLDQPDLLNMTRQEVVEYEKQEDKLSPKESQMLLLKFFGTPDIKEALKNTNVSESEFKELTSRFDKALFRWAEARGVKGINRKGLWRNPNKATSDEYDAAIAAWKLMYKKNEVPKDMLGKMVQIAIQHS